MHSTAPHIHHNQRQSESLVLFGMAAWETDLGKVQNSGDDMQQMDQ
jgi:hypothetical protein